MARHPALQLIEHAWRVTRRRRAHGPRRPGWEWTHEVVQSMLRHTFGRTGDPVTARRVLDAPGRLVPSRGCRFVPGRPGGVPSVMVAPPRYDDRILIYLHGGGYVMGSPTSHRPLLVGLARWTGSRVLAVDYRLAPEHPCPAAIDDVVAVWDAVRAAGVAPSRVVLLGDSAGGGLALTSLLAMRDTGRPLPGRAVLLSPWTDLAMTGDSLVTEVDDYLGEPHTLDTNAGRYAGELDRRDPRVSPLYAEDLSGLSPTLSLVGGAERLLDDGTRMHDRLVAAGVEATLHVEPHAVHVYPMFHDVSAQGRAGLDRIVDWLAG